ncbi:uncharacterized protein LOC101855043 [Aplysia californica]|uniref:Uncharacterized protein LOC101855043 n=1 Tax=Aplysia californica TaxID=6500 RepID=A0ABM0K029_APLCA|nr:uncharacterized protein LOC101855043 [Aplysia californica]
MSAWNKQVVLQFIKLYESLPCLWKVKSKAYSNKLTKELAYAKLIEFCQKHQESADKHFVVNKINNLRSSFRKELKKVERLNAGPVRAYRPKLWYYDHLMFVKDQEIPGRGRSSLGSDHVPLPSTRDDAIEKEEPMSPEAPSEYSIGSAASEEHQTDPVTSHVSFQVSPHLSSPGSSPGSSSQVFQSIVRPTPTAPTAKRPSKRKHGEDDEVLNVSRARLLNPPTPMTLEDENDAFGKTISHLLRGVTREQRIHARKLMFEVMYEAELGNLSRFSCVVVAASDTDTCSKSPQTSGCPTNQQHT